ncbi:MAG: type III-A CRISPR-associated RAMP protein Csm3, partial [Desulfovibrio sp.]|nr:type III-A CRISPR-associated RAMP protein Csm3 [Desulfovibrio sp.]
LERVPAGVRFAFNIGFRVYRGDPADLMQWLFRCLRLVELDALGGSGSRGCGEVRFLDIHVDGKPEYANLDAVAIF